STGVVQTAHDRGVVPRWQVCNDRTFPRVSGSVTTVLNSASLVAGNDSAYNAGLPVIITRNQGSGAVVQFQGRISQCIGNRVLSELRTNGTNNDCLRSAPFNNEAANHHVVAGLNKGARGDVIKLRRHDRGIPLDERVVDVVVIVEIVADGPAIRRRSARHPIEVVLNRGVGGRGDDGPRWTIPTLGERLQGVAGGEVADGPAIRGRSARYPTEGYGVGRGDNGPRCPVPMLDQRLASAVADGPAIRRRSARHPAELVVICGARVGRGDDGPRCPVPPFDERMVGLVFDDAQVVIGADGPAIRRRSTRHPTEAVALRGAGVRRGDDGPLCPVPV